MKPLRRLAMPLLRGRGFIASIAALLIAWQAQLTYEAHDLAGAGLYLLAAGVLVVGYLFSYQNRRFFRIGSYVPTAGDATSEVVTTLRVRRVAGAPLAGSAGGPNRQARYLAAIYVAKPAIAPARIWRGLATFRGRWGRLALGAVALLVSVVAVIMHQRDQLDWRALLLWAASPVLFALACAGQKLGLWPLAASNPDELNAAEDEGPTQRRSGQAARLEWLLLGLILLAAIWFRTDGLSYSVIGIHSDEAEIGLIARALLHGNFAVAPPLTTANWYYFPSGTMWTMLPGMALLGDDTPAGIHFSSALFSVLDILRPVPAGAAVVGIAPGADCRRAAGGRWPQPAPLRSTRQAVSSWRCSGRSVFTSSSRGCGASVTSTSCGVATPLPPACSSIPPHARFLSCSAC